MMKIQGTNLAIRSSGYQRSSKVEMTSLEVRIGPKSSGETTKSATSSDVLNKSNLSNVSSISSVSKSMNASKTLNVSNASGGSNEERVFSDEFISLEAMELQVQESLLSEMDNLKIKLIEMVLSAWLGYAFKMDHIAFYASDVSGGDMTSPGWGVSYSHYEAESKEQVMNLQAEGKVILEDGREIQVDYHLSMSEQFTKSHSESFQAGNILLDPIVINYDGPSASLTQEKFEFDMDMDGTKDKIAFATNGSGFLALDRNNNGSIDDGSELFGPSTNDGFSELREFDEDGNGWIDENDGVFDQLKIWERHEDGSSKLIGLGEAGVGAIYLKEVSTAFDLSDNQLEMQGKMRTSSIFLKEDGSAGSVHEIDLVLK